MFPHVGGTSHSSILAVLLGRFTKSNVTRSRISTAASVPSPSGNILSPSAAAGGTCCSLIYATPRGSTRQVCNVVPGKDGYCATRTTSTCTQKTPTIPRAAPPSTRSTHTHTIIRVASCSRVRQPMGCATSHVLGGLTLRCVHAFCRRWATASRIARLLRRAVGFRIARQLV